MPIWKQRQFSRLMNQQAAEGGEGGGGGGLQITPEIQALIDSRVESTVAGLKAKNGELIAANKDIKTKFDALNSQFEGFDMEAVKGLLSRASKDEETKLLAEGKIDEVFEKRTERYRNDVARQIEAKDVEINRHIEANKKLAGRALSDALIKAASKAGAEPHALEDIVLRGKASGWSVDVDGNVVAMSGEDVVRGKDGKTPLTPDEWVESLRESAPHLWPRAQGTGAPGSSATGASGKTITRDKFNALTPAEQKKAMLVDKLTIVG